MEKEFGPEKLKKSSRKTKADDELLEHLRSSGKKKTKNVLFAKKLKMVYG